MIIDFYCKETEKLYNMTKKISPPHPGEILMEEFMKPLDISQYRLAKDISVPPIRISEILRGKRAISANTALRLARYFGTTAEFWLNLQNHYDLEKEEAKISKNLKVEVKILQTKLTEKMSCG